MTSFSHTSEHIFTSFLTGVEECPSRFSSSAKNTALLLPRNAFIVETERDRIIVDPLTVVVLERLEKIKLIPFPAFGNPRYLYMEVPEAAVQGVTCADFEGSAGIARIRDWEYRGRSDPDPLAPILQTSTKLIQSLQHHPDACEGYALALMDMLPVGNCQIMPDADGKSLSQRCMEIALGQGLFSFREIAHQLNVPAFSLYRRFQQEIGTSIHKYSNSMRLALAWTWLDDSTRNITDVALETGFSSHSHFTSAFRHRFGFPPSRRQAIDLIPRDENRRSANPF